VPQFSSVVGYLLVFTVQKCDRKVGSKCYVTYSMNVSQNNTHMQLCTLQTCCSAV
jgi:hypothetical protein